MRNIFIIIGSIILIFLFFVGGLYLNSWAVEIPSFLTTLIDKSACSINSKFLETILCKSEFVIQIFYLLIFLPTTIILFLKKKKILSFISISFGSGIMLGVFLLLNSY